MDVFDGSISISSTSLIDSEITEVKFETAENFDLNFFDTPDDSLTQVAFSNPNSVESSTSPTPEPVAITQQLVTIKNGKNGQNYFLILSMHDAEEFWFANLKV
jgi:hypothetical protein